MQSWLRSQNARGVPKEDAAASRPKKSSCKELGMSSDS